MVTEWETRLKNQILDNSYLHLYSIGVVIEDNVNNDFIIKAIPIEKISFPENSNKKGDLNHPSEFKPLNLPFINKDKISLETLDLIKDNYLLCQWLNLDSNRITPPNVHKGELVRIYRYSNTPLFYWSVLNPNLELRKREHIVWELSNKDSIKKTDEDRYRIVISTKEKIIQLHTGVRDNEYTTYDLTLDTGNGNLKILDGKGNFIELDSRTDTININTDNEINIHATNKYNLTTIDTNINSSNSIKNLTTNYTLTAKNSIKTETNIEDKKANNSYTLTTPSYKVVSGSVSIGNGKDLDLINLISDLITAIENIQHVGNLGKPTTITGSSRDMLETIKSKFKRLKG